MRSSQPEPEKTCISGDTRCKLAEELQTMEISGNGNELLQMTCIRCHREFERNLQDDQLVMPTNDGAEGLWCSDCTFEYRLYENIRR